MSKKTDLDTILAQGLEHTMTLYSLENCKDPSEQDAELLQLYKEDMDLFEKVLDNIDSYSKELKMETMIASLNAVLFICSVILVILCYCF